MPVPILNTTTPPPIVNATTTTTAALQGAASASANATAATTVTKTASAGAGQVIGEAASKLVGGMFSGGLLSGQALVWLITIILLILVGFPLTIWLFKRFLAASAGRGVTMPWIYYDPVEDKHKYTVLYRIAPNIYAAEDGSVVALARQDSKPVELEVPLERSVKRKNGTRALYGVKIGDAVFDLKYVDELVFTLFGERISGINTAAKLILLLREKGIFDNSVRINPNMSIVVSAKQDELAKYVANMLGSLAADVMIDLGAMTGNRQEFQAWVRQLVELEKERMEAVSRTVTKVAVVVFILILFGGIILMMLPTLFGG